MSWIFRPLDAFEMINRGMGKNSVANHQNSLELLKIKNRQMNITNLVLMKNQAVTKVIQMFPPKPRPGGVNAVRTAAGRRFYAECQQNGGGNI